MSCEYHQPETEASRRKRRANQPAAPTSEAAGIHGTSPDRGDDLEHAPGLSDGQFHHCPPGTELPLARKEFEFGDRRCFRDELVDALCRLRDAPGSADAYPNLSAYIELLREDAEYFRTSAGRTDVEQLLDDSPDDRDGLPQQAVSYLAERRHGDLWEPTHLPRERKPIETARPLTATTRCAP